MKMSQRYDEEQQQLKKDIEELLHFTQEHYLKIYGKPLFDDAIDALDHGPVTPEVYSVYKKYGDTS